MKTEDGWEKTNLSLEVLARLPKTVQAEIARLVSNVNQYKRKVNEVTGGSQGSNTSFLPSYDEPPQPLPNNAHVRFHLGASGERRGSVDCYITEQGRLLFYLEEAVAILPAGGVNVFQVAFLPDNTPAPQAVPRIRTRKG